MRERERDRDLQSAPIAISPANIPVAVDRDLAFARSHRIEIAIDGVISRSVDCDLGSSSLAYIREIAPSITISIRSHLAKVRSRSTATGMFADEIAIGADWRSRSLSLSLSLSLSQLIFRKYFEGKIEV